MLKFVFYLIFFYLVGYYYAVMTKGTVFDNFFVMLISLFFLIFLFEWIFSRFKKKNTKASDVDKGDGETWEEMVQSVKADFEKTWKLEYRENEIQIVNKYNQEELYINGKLVCESKRKSWYSWVIPYQTLSGVIEESNQPRVVKVKLGGLLSLNCEVYVDKQLIFKEKIKYNLFSGGIKGRD